MTLKISIIILVLAVVCLLIGWFKNYMLYYRLQKLAESYPMDFRLFVAGEEGWTTFDSNETDGKGCIKLIPNPVITTSYYYYIKFEGPISEKLAIKFLLSNFTRYINERNLARRGRY